MEVDRVVVGDRVFVPGGPLPRAVFIRSGKIVKIGTRDEIPPGVPVLDAGALAVLPGLVDTHVHVNDPGRADWEGWDTATRAAAAGGVTMLCDMPLNSIPPTTTRDGLAAKLRALEGRAFVDVGLVGGLVPGDVAALEDCAREGVLAFKCFLAESGVDEFSHVDDVVLRRGMKELARLGAPLFVHAELPGPLAEAEKRVLGLDPRSYEAWLRARPRSAEDAAVELVIETALATGARAHVVHLSSSDALDLVRRAKDRRVPLTVETCPHYLTFASEEIPDGATEYKCAPPIRESENREKLWGALADGTIAQVVTDHSPAPGTLKCSESGDFTKAWGGIASLELGLRAVWTEARARGHALADVVRWMCEGPARLVGVHGRKGVLDVGADADLVFFDEEADFVVDPAKLSHRHPITPYRARPLKGRVVRTILRGEVVYDDGLHVGTPGGRWVRHGVSA